MCELTLKGKKYYFSLTRSEVKDLVEDHFDDYIKERLESGNRFDLLEAYISILLVTVCNEHKNKVRSYHQ